MRNFIGHRNIIDNLKKRIDLNEVSHANIIVGENGIGKSNLAMKLARDILGKSQDKNYIDIIKYRTKKSSFGVDEIRDVVEEINKKPFEGDKKVIIIYDGNKMTTQAQNAFLKTIEEPPSGVYIILLCESLELILDTIKSRCQIYKLSPLKKEEVEEYIKLNLNIEQNITDDEIKASIAYSEGIPGRAEEFLKNEELRELRDIILNLLFVLIKNNMKEILEYENKILSLKENKEDILNILASFIRDIIIYKEINSEDRIINGDKIKDIEVLAMEMSYKKLSNIIEKIGEARKSLLSNSNFQLIIRVMLIGFMEV